MPTFRELDVFVGIYDDEGRRLDRASPVSDCECKDKKDPFDAAIGAARDLAPTYRHASFLHVLVYDPDTFRPLRSYWETAGGNEP